VVAKHLLSGDSRIFYAEEYVVWASRLTAEPNGANRNSRNNRKEPQRRE
jgi:hypothetical protein